VSVARRARNAEVPSVRLTPSSQRSRTAPTAAHYAWAAIGLAAFTVYGSLLPFHFTSLSFAEAVEAFRRAIVWDPTDLAARGDWVVSAVQYSLLSFALMGAACCDRRWMAGTLAGPLVLSGCAAFAVGVEFLQVYFPPRTVSVNDIVVETGGATLGIVGWLAVGRRMTVWVRRLEGVTGLAGLARRFIPAYLVVLLIVQLMPFDFVISRDELAAKVTAGNIQLIPFADDVGLAEVGKAGLYFAAFLPLGVLSALARGRAGGGGSWADIGPVLLAPAAVTAGKVFVYSRVFDASDIVAGMAGILAGWRIGGLVRPQALVTWASQPRLGYVGVALWLLWFAAIGYVNWRPFDFTVDPAQFAKDPQDLPQFGLRHMSMAPFVDYYWNSKYNALDRFVVKGLTFVPVGILLALSTKSIYRRGAGFWAVTMAAVPAIAVEAGRYFLPNHLPSVTDVLIQCAGAWVGFRITQFIRATLWAEATLYGWLRPSPEPLHFITAQPDVLPMRQAQ
jgi:VanZ family protein